MAALAHRLLAAVRPDPPLGPPFVAAVTAAVAAAEATSAAEVVVVVRPCSGSYRDIDYLCGAAAAWLCLLVTLFSSFDVPPAWVPVETAIAFGLGAVLCARSPARRWLTTRRRRTQHVLDAARAAFVHESVGDTAERAGILVYWSRLERRAEVLPDLAVVRAVPADVWNAWLFEVRAAERSPDPALLLTALGNLAPLLANSLPCPAGHSRRLPDAPRMAP